MKTKDQRFRLRLTRAGHWIEGTWIAPSREEAEQIAREWAEKWMRGHGPVTIEDGQT